MVNTVPPKAAQNNAERGLRLREEWGRGGTDVGVSTARKLKAGGSLSRSTIAKMSAFARHKQNYQPDKKEPDGGATAGTIAWLLWGGTTGINWANDKLKEIDNDKGYDMQIEQKFIDITDFSIKSDGSEIEGYASVFGNLDSYKDIVEKGAFSKTIKRRKPKMLWQHRQDMPIGIWEVAKEDDKGLLVKGKFANTGGGNDAKELARMGAVDGLSIGFAVKVAEFDEKKGTRKLKEIDLFEVSLVTFPANDKATVTSVKSEDINTIRDFERFLRDAGFSKADSVRIASRGFTSEADLRDAEQVELKKLIEHNIKLLRGA